MSSSSPAADRRKARSKNGCLTCRIRKVKCDERRPVCKRCENSPNKCEWLEPGQSLSARGQPSKSFSSPVGYGSPRLIASSESPNTDLTPTDSASPADFISPGSSREPPRTSLSAAHIALANSLRLSSEDRAAFAYVPSSILVLSYGKLWPWSNFSYIYTHIASQYPGVMRSFIAVADMELRARDLLTAQDAVDPAEVLERASRLGSSATVHYSQALQDLSSLLSHICQTAEQSRDVDALFTMWFLILRYLDADSATGNINSGQFCLDFLSRDAHDYISHEHLFQSVRSALPKIWGEQYPVSELLDDLENYRPLRLYHLCQGAKLELLRLARSTTHDGSEENSLKKLWRHVENFGDEFIDILLLAKKTPSSGGKRLMWTVYAAALDFHALQILCSSLDTYQETSFKPEVSLSYIFAVATKALREDPRQIYRFMWSLSVALGKTQGHGSQAWLSTQLARARVLLPRFGVPGLVLEQCSGIQMSNEG
ncbi:transcriptional regulatory [Fusarium sporotrichioides]|uniref:Transcriptional regulatory n=1 Tax=Fusarium sporotrichioides TaxID=5514 RepID=A0A395SR84_FUSSP|nr:transcriptional regulatory [Fusarium sporotrichioides]